MSRASRVGLALLASATALGILGDALLQGQPLGLNVGVWVACFVLALAVLLRLSHAPLHQGRRWMAAPLLVFGALFAWHDSPLLVAANLVALAAAVSMGALRRTRPKLAAAAITDYCSGLFSAGCSALAGAIPLLMTDIRWSEVTRHGRSPKVAAVARGLAIGAPLLLLFGGLFVAADAVFKQLLVDALPSVSASTVGRVVLVAVIAWLSGGLLRDLLAAREERRVVPAGALEPFKVSARVGATELNVALAILDVLFLAFVLVQFRYLFGGRGHVDATAGLTYAEYARHGFFELVAVAALTLPLLLVGDWALRGDDRGRRVFCGLAALLLALLAVVMASALQRLRLYVDQFGLTELRLYAAGVILWIAAVCGWFALTVLRGRRHLFAVGAVAAGFAATLALNVLDPDALIARTNVTRPAVDVGYLSGLSDDAVPTLVARLDDLAPEQRVFLARSLLERMSRTSGDWRSWNRSRARAARVLRAHRAELQRLGAAIAAP
jgi:Domain of unknown function (DUF4173)